jgi:hypothetical protein
MGTSYSAFVGGLVGHATAPRPCCDALPLRTMEPSVTPRRGAVVALAMARARSGVIAGHSMKALVPGTHSRAAMRDRTETTMWSLSLGRAVPGIKRQRLKRSPTGPLGQNREDQP